MKPILRTLAVLLLTIPVAVSAEDKTASKDAALSTNLQKFSYAIGLQIGESIKGKGIKLDPNALTTAISDVLKDKKPRLSEDELQKAVSAHENEMSSENMKAGDAFRAAFKKKDGVKELPGGVLYRVIKEGTGKSPSLDDVISVNYSGKVISGREFDNSARHGGAVDLQLGKVIKGWQTAVPHMKEGGKWEIVVPPDQAYGEKGAGGVIGPNETLVFDIELVKIKGAPAN